MRMESAGSGSIRNNASEGGARKKRGARSATGWIASRATITPRVAMSASKGADEAMHRSEEMTRERRKPGIRSVGSEPGAGGRRKVDPGVRKPGHSQVTEPPFHPPASTANKTTRRRSSRRKINYKYCRSTDVSDDDSHHCNQRNVAKKTALPVQRLDNFDERTRNSFAGRHNSHQVEVFKTLFHFNDRVIGMLLCLLMFQALAGACQFVIGR